MANVKRIDFRNNDELSEAVNYVITTLLGTPSMVEKLPNHIYYRLEGIERYVRNRGHVDVLVSFKNTSGKLS